MKNLLLIIDFGLYKSKSLKALGPNIYSVCCQSSLLESCLGWLLGVSKSIYGIHRKSRRPQLTGNYVAYAAAYDTYAKGISGGAGFIVT